MKITVDHPQFEAFLEDGAKQNNQTKDAFFEKLIISLFINQQKKEAITDKEILEDISSAYNKPIKDISKYMISDLNYEIMKKHFSDDFNFGSLEFKIELEK